MTKKKWTTEEIQYLKDNLGKMKVPTIASKLNRTVTAVLMKMKRLRIGNTRDQVGLLTIYELANLCNVNSTTAKRWVRYHGLEVIEKITRIERRYSFICPEHFWDWASNNKDKIDFTKIEHNSIPPEPKWVTPLRSLVPKSTTYKSWSTKEESLLLLLSENGHTVDKISKTLNRTKISVQRKLYRIRRNKN
ncbi:hypothetical protein ACFSO7_21690 [Bacillus sp. CGMCC 1.16607]|uniref:hypothetical protein n=1 Tax=Bacillus sp. CGMCC 1.16607 TaxID=3351842 RepID=UPI0036429DF2